MSTPSISKRRPITIQASRGLQPARCFVSQGDPVGRHQVAQAKARGAPGAHVRHTGMRGIRVRAAWLALGSVCAAVNCLPLCGCTYSGGELLYLLGVGRGRKVEAQFRLTEGPLLLLVDDPAQRVDWPMTGRYLTDELARELIEKKAAGRIIPREALDRLRQSEPDLHQRGCRELGRMTGARQVLWIEVHDFLAPEQIEAAGEAAYLTVTVKIINSAKTERGSRPRLWPTSPRGHTVSATLGGGDVLRLKTKDAISRELASKLAGQIARLFYDHRLEDFESGK